jgi:hypothetical protein
MFGYMQIHYFRNLEFFGPQMALVYRLDAISKGPKNSWFQGPTPTHLSS